MSKELVLVVGAGASAEVELPVGSELKSRIRSVMDAIVSAQSDSGVVGQALTILFNKDPGALPGGWRAVDEACRIIRNGMPLAPSIDTFIDVHVDKPCIAVAGKLAIAHCLTEAERRSKLYVDHTNSRSVLDLRTLQDTWFHAFFQRALGAVRVPQLQDRLSKIGIITFNYDRCIEQFIHAAIRSYFSLDEAQATEAMNALRIVHVYGSLGPLPWAGGSGPHVRFGEDVNAWQLPGVAKSLKTFSEAFDDQDDHIVEIREMLKGASRIGILGFSFNPQNMSLLFGPAGRTVKERVTPVYSTGRGLSVSDIEATKEQLHTLAGFDPQDIRVEKGQTCADLFATDGRSLVGW